MFRLLTGIAAGVALAFAFAANSASAKQVYDYKYSGTFFDGSGSEKGSFTNVLGDIGYDKTAERLYVAASGSPGVVEKFTKAGAASNFSGLNGGAGQDYIDLGRNVPNFAPNQTELAVDNSNQPTTGNIYMRLGTSDTTLIWGYHPDGLLIGPGYTQEYNVVYCQIAPCAGAMVPYQCGLAVSSTGELWLAGSQFGGHGRRDPETLDFDNEFFTAPESCEMVIDGNRNFYGIWSRETFSEGNQGIWAVKLPPEPVNNNVGPPEREWRYRLNASSAGQNVKSAERTPTHLAIDESDDDVFLSEGTPPQETRISQFDSSGRLLGRFGGPEGGYLGLSNIGGLTVDPATHDVWVTNNRSYSGVRHVEKFERTGPFTVPTTETEPVTRVEGPAKATLHGVVNPDGVATTECYFEYGLTPSLGNKAPCIEGNVFSGSSNFNVSAVLTGLKTGTEYWYKLFAKNGNNRISDGAPGRFIAQGLPIAEPIFVDDVNTDGARFDATIDPNGGRTYYHWEYGLTEAYESSTPETRLDRRDPQDLETLPTSIVDPYTVKDRVIELTPGATYHVRLVTKNEEGVKAYPDQEFHTYLPDPGADPCPNALVRQQTRASLLLDCRAYELASAAKTGGHDVVSDLVPGQEPLVAYPSADGKVLYSVDNAVIPGIEGNPTNLGRDPYVATRDKDTGWSTKYVGLPSDGMEDPDLFGSPLLGADAGLNTFAFGGANICNPCFEDGSTNEPLRLPNGEVVRGMAGFLNPAGDPSQTALKPFSADGSHFVFGSDSLFEEDGDAEGSIYDRDLNGGGTQVVSTLPGGGTMTGGEVAELDVSSNGSRILVAQKVSTDVKGNTYWHPYMHVGTSPNTVDLAPGTTSGVLYAGMSADGTRVFFSTPDKLIPADEDTSADIYEAEVPGSGPATLSLVSVEGSEPSNSDACTPPGEIPWDTVAGPPDCSAVAFAGGAGVSENGSIYFLSPELLDGPANGEANEANLYVMRPGEEPRFVATIDSSAAKPPPQLPDHPASTFRTGLSAPESMAVDQSTGDVYVYERGSGGNGKIARYTSAGAAKNFTAGPFLSGGKIVGLPNEGEGTTGIAFDNAPGSPLNGMFYATAESEVLIFESSGEPIESLSGFALPCGLAVDQSNGDVYVGDPLVGTIWRFHPTSGAPPTYTKTGLKPQGMFACQVGVDKAGRVYASEYPVGPVKRFNAADFAAAPPTKVGTTITATGSATATDPANDDLYVNEESKVSRYDSSGTLIQTFGGGKISASLGVTVNGTSKHVYAPNGAEVIDFGFEPHPYQPIDNPAVMHAVQQNGVHSFADFQVTPDGRYAAFSSALPLTNYPKLKHTEIYRYDAETNSMSCPSCLPTRVAPISDTSLSPYGRNLTDDGRVLFTSLDSFVLRDANRKLDAYEWKNGEVQLISTGLSSENSTLLSVSSDGKDAYFFTRDKLVENDSNGGAVRVYDAREKGGFFIDPPTLPCAASDECHGPGSAAPGPPNINTQTGEGAGEPAKRAATCKRGFVKRHGRCVKKPRRQHRKRARHHG
jgi:hypothetical protein